MSDASTARMMRAYNERSAKPIPFLSGFFASPAENFYTQEEVEIDIQRSGEHVAVVVQDLAVGSRQNEATVYTNKRFKAPVYSEEFTLNSFELMRRRPGQNPFEDIDFLGTAKREFNSHQSLVEDKIRRAIELQAAQVLSTGKLELKDSAGATLYALDFKPKVAHFPGASTPWAGGSMAGILTDLEGLADVINIDGKSEPGRIILGRAALRAFLGNDDVRRLLDNRRMDLGAIERPRGNGGKFHGWISVGQYSFEIWSYAGWYLDPQTGNATHYVADDLAIMLAPGRLDLTFGAIPSIVGPDPRLAPLGLGRNANGGGGMDLHSSAWVSPDGRALHGSVAARPLCIPTAIDTFGAIDTGAA